MSERIANAALVFHQKNVIALFRLYGGFLGFGRLGRHEFLRRANEAVICNPKLLIRGSPATRFVDHPATDFITRLGVGKHEQFVVQITICINPSQAYSPLLDLPARAAPRKPRLVRFNGAGTSPGRRQTFATVGTGLVQAMDTFATDLP
jgi:hypothetical protein